MRAMREAIERAVGEDGLVEERHPLIHGAIVRDDGGGAPVPLDQDVEEVTGLPVSLRKPEVVENSRRGRGGAPAAAWRRRSDPPSGAASGPGATGPTGRHAAEQHAHELAHGGAALLSLGVGRAHRVRGAILG